MCYLLLLLSVLLVVQVRSIDLDITIEKKTGEYSLLVNKKKYLESFEYGIRTNTQWYSSGGSIGKSKKKLILKTSSVTKGYDENHRSGFLDTTLLWETEDSKLPYITSFREFSDISAIIFTQTFPNGLKNSSLKDSNDVISSFPSFKVRDLVSDLNYLVFEGNQLRQSKAGHWDAENLYKGGSLSGPIALYNEKLDGIVISPLSNFMVGSQIRDSKSIPMDFACGLNGNIDDVPANLSHSTLIFAATGINELFLSYGDFLLSHFGKRRVETSEDLVISHLSYWTDNGAYYYYLTEPNLNYEQTIKDVAEYLKSENLPVKSIQLDSWWYVQENGGIKLWEPANNIFPDGIKDVTTATGLPVSLHSKYFSLDNDYLKKMNFSFIYDEGGKAAIPETEDLYVYIMSKAKSWGMILYEQDWLQIVYTGISAIQSTVDTGKNWFSNMAGGAKTVGVKIQLCSIYPAMILQTLETPQSVITQSRASSDYHPSHKQFDIGLSSMFIYGSSGLIPYKDTFFSTNEEEKGCKYTSGMINKCKEVNNVLQVVISALSNGPVGIGDGISYVNTELVMETCTSDGLLLKSDRPAFVIDEVFRKNFHDPIVIVDKVWGTYTQFEGFATYYYIFSMDLFLDFKFYPNMFPNLENDDGDSSSSSSFYAIKYVPGEEKISSISLMDKDHPITLKRSYLHPIEGLVDFEYHTFAPKINGCRYTFLKEMKKVVSVSKTRVKSISCDSQKTSLEIFGEDDEHVTLAFLEEDQDGLLDNTNSNIMYVDCVINSGFSVVVCEQGECACT